MYCARAARLEIHHILQHMHLQHHYASSLLPCIVIVKMLVPLLLWTKLGTSNWKQDPIRRVAMMPALQTSFQRSVINSSGEPMSKVKTEAVATCICCRVRAGELVAQCSIFRLPWLHARRFFISCFNQSFVCI